MKPFVARALMLGMLAGSVLWAAPPGAQEAERTAAAHLLARGTLPPAGQASPAAPTAAATVAEVIDWHRTQLAQDPAAQEAVLERARHDAFGPDVEGGPRRPAALYFELVQQHVQELATDPEAYDRVLTRAYQTVIRRDPYDLELDYWKQRDPLPYVVLVACIEDWARRNQPGLMVTSGRPTVSPNTDLLTAFQVSPAVATEVRDVLAREPDPVATAGRRTVLTPGAEEVVTRGGMHLLVANAR